MDDLISEFITETSESLAVLDLELVKLEQNPDDQEILSNIFRLVHTIKGTCGFLGLPRLESVAHSGENVLGKIRDGEIAVSEQAISLVLECLDCIRDIVEYLTDNGEEPEGDDKPLTNRLDAFAASGGTDTGESGGDSSAVESDGASQAAGADGVSLDADAAAALSEPPIEGGGNMTQEELDAMERAFAEAEVLVDGFEPANDGGAVDGVEVEEHALIPSEDVAGEEKVAEVPAPAAVKEEVRKEGVKQGLKAGGAVSGKEAPKEAAVNQSIRVNLNVLEHLMQTVGELVLTRNQLMQVARHMGEQELTSPLQQLSNITTELQEGVMKTRMQPIGNAWSKFPRLIRDLSLDLDKKIELQMIGQDTELDRQMLDMIKDPLTHMVRNSCDHGIEMPAERVEAGKSEVGTVKLHAYHEGGHIIIDIIDDGKGVNIDRVKEKAVENEVVSAEEIETLTDQQIMQFIFAPGFSTAEKVTNVSGRGVGMDVVRTNIEKIGGTVELSSTPGHGSTFHIKIPLTLAIVSVLIVESAKERFAIPQINVLELVRAEKDSSHRIEHINNAPVLRLREKLLPLITLANVLEIQEQGELVETSAAVNDNLTEGEAVEVSEVADAAAVEAIMGDGASGVSEVAEEDGFIVVCAIGGYEFGVIVDTVFDTEEIVVKPVSGLLSEIDVYSGNTILGDGSVIMILDPNGLARKTSSNGSIKQSSEQTDADAMLSDVSGGNMVKYLLFTSGDESPKAVPLELVSRLEDIQISDIEYSTGKPVIQYRGGLMRLRTLPGQEIPASGHTDAIVFNYDNHPIGLIVDEICDIVEAPLHIQSSVEGDEFLGSLVIADKTTDIVDIGYLLSDLINARVVAADNESGTKNLRAKSLLLVEDSPFFRKLLVPTLEELGCHVSVAASGAEAVKLLERNSTFDAIVTDIEMPGMDGFEFADKVKKEKLCEAPVLAFTSTVNQNFLNRAEEVGMVGVVLKTDRSKLIEILGKIFESDSGQEVA